MAKVKEGRKVFFSEEKKQKTFVSGAADGSGTWPERWEAART
jgi:hypothetical protein